VKYGISVGRGAVDWEVVAQSLVILATNAAVVVVAAAAVVVVVEVAVVVDAAAEEAFEKECGRYLLL